MLVTGAVVATVLTTLVIPTPASAVGYLTPSASQVRVGGAVTLATDLCASGDTVTALRMAVQDARAKGLAPYMPIDPVAAGLTQTAGGTTFTVTATTAYTELRFQLDCSDGSQAISGEPVRVFPPAPEFWWNYNNYGPVFTATPGFVFSLGAFVMDCPDGAATHLVFTGPGATTPLIAMDGTVDGTTVLFDLDLPADMPQGVYTAAVTCRGAGGSITQSVPVTVGADTTPATGGSPLIAAWAAMTLTAGLALRRMGRRPAAAHGH